MEQKDLFFKAPDKGIFAVAFEQIYFKRALESVCNKWKGPEAIRLLFCRQRNK